MSFNLSITDKPTHVVVWTDSSNVSDLVKTLTERVASLEETVSKLMNTGLLSGIEMRRREDSISVVQESDSKDLFKELIEKSQVKQVYIQPTAFTADACQSESEAISVDDADADADADAEAEAQADADDADDDDAEDTAGTEDDDDDDADGTEEALELDEFEYKGVTYFKDTENQVYQVGADGDLDDTPIGVWNAEKQKVLKYAKA